MIVRTHKSKKQFIILDDGRYYYTHILGTLSQFKREFTLEDIDQQFDSYACDFRGMLEDWRVDMNSGISGDTIDYEDLELSYHDRKQYLFESYLQFLFDSVMKRGRPIDFDFHKAFTRLNLSMRAKSVSLKAEQRFLDGHLITYYTDGDEGIKDRPLLLQELYGVIMSDLVTVVS